MEELDHDSLKCVGHRTVPLGVSTDAIRSNDTGIKNFLGMYDFMFHDRWIIQIVECLTKISFPTLRSLAT